MSAIQGGWAGVPYEIPEGADASAATDAAQTQPTAATSGAGGIALDSSKVAYFSQAIATQTPAQLSQTIASGLKSSPQEFRAALSSALDAKLKDAPDLQRHLTMLDANGDGKVSPQENYDTLRDLGFSRLRALAVGGASQLALLATTGDKGGLSIAVDGGDAGRHKAVDTGAMDPKQDLSKKLDEMMAEDKDGDGYITDDDINRFIDKRADESTAGTVAKTLIKTANKAEFASLFKLMNGKMSRADLQDFYAGSLFYSLLPPDALAQRLVAMRGK